jgi:hypothetical protein
MNQPPEDSVSGGSDKQLARLSDSAAPERPLSQQLVDAASALLGAIPSLGPLLQKGFDARIQDHLEKQDRVLLSRLSENQICLEDVLENPRLSGQVHAILSILDAARRAESEDKARRFADLFTAYATGRVPHSELCEFTQLLSEISDREWVVLLIIRRHMPAEPHQTDSAKEWERDISARWKLTEPQIVEAGVKGEETYSFLSRLSRTGLVRVINVKLNEDLPPYVTLPQSRLEGLVAHLGLSDEPPVN